jgi:hypothetical protein
MQVRKTKGESLICMFNPGLIFPLIFTIIASCGGSSDPKKGPYSTARPDSLNQSAALAEFPSISILLVLPENPEPGRPFRIFATGGKNIRNAEIVVNGPSGKLESLKSKTGKELPYWRIDDFEGGSAGGYKATLIADKEVVAAIEFTISQKETIRWAGVVWKTRKGWDSSMETIYSAWINALFQGYDEQSSWPALHEVTRDKERNFLYNYLSLDEDDPDGKTRLIIQPDCADNPFFMRAYFSWKLGLPFGYHICDRGYLGHNPGTGQWITNETATSGTNPVLSFNNFLRRIMDGVHSGTARTALDNEKSDYYPVALEREALRPGVVFADPYGHTLIIVSWVPQRNGHPGLLLAVDAQPDGTVGIKRFWKGNFLFTTSDVIGEPGFKAFRPIAVLKGVPTLMQNKELTVSSGFVPFSLQQRKMNDQVFYHTMEQIINPKPLDPETRMLDLIQALYEQLIVRVTSVNNGDAYLKSHPGALIPMPSRVAAIFQAGGQWEDFSTPNRDLRLLIAMDAVLDFPDQVVRSPGDYNISKLASPEQVKKKLQSIMDQKVSDLSITYSRSDGSLQKLIVGEVLKRRDAFEMAYNPNDCIEIRWGAPENSEERAGCNRHTPPNQLATMRLVRPWFRKRLHPPT